MESPSSIAYAAAFGFWEEYGWDTACVAPSVVDLARVIDKAIDNAARMPR